MPYVLVEYLDLNVLGSQHCNYLHLKWNESFINNWFCLNC